WSAVLVESEVRIREVDEADPPVQTPVEGEVRTLRIDRVVRGVVHRHQECVLRAEMIGEVYPERGVAAVVLTDLDAVEVDLGTGVRAADLQPRSAALWGRREPPGIGAPAAMVVVAAILPVLGVPGVREAHLLAGGQDLVPGRSHRHWLTGERPSVDELVDDSGMWDMRAQGVSSGRNVLVCCASR